MPHFASLLARRRGHPAAAEAQASQLVDRLRQELRKAAPDPTAEARAGRAFWLAVFAAQQRLVAARAPAPEVARLHEALRQGLGPAAERLTLGTPASAAVRGLPRVAVGGSATPAAAPSATAACAPPGAAAGGNARPPVAGTTAPGDARPAVEATPAPGNARPAAEATPAPGVARSDTEAAPAASRDILLAQGYRLHEHRLGDPQLAYDLCLLLPDPATRCLHAYVTSCDRLGNACAFFNGLLQLPRRHGHDVLLPATRFSPAQWHALMLSLHGKRGLPDFDVSVEVASLIDFLGPTLDGPWPALAKKCAAAFAARPVAPAVLRATLERLARNGPAVAGWARPCIAQMALSEALRPLDVSLAVVQLVVEQHVGLWSTEACLQWVVRYAQCRKGAQQSVGQFLAAQGLLQSPAWAYLSLAALRQPQVQALFDDRAYGRLLRQRAALPASALLPPPKPPGLVLSEVTGAAAARQVGCHGRIDDFVARFARLGSRRFTAELCWLRRLWTVEVSKRGLF